MYPLRRRIGVRLNVVGAGPNARLAGDGHSGGMNVRAFVAPLVAAVSLLLVSRSAEAATCVLSDHTGVDDAEAKTAAEMMCNELSSRAPNASFDVRLGKLNGRELITVTAADGHRVRTFLSGLDELDLAAPRLASALIEEKPLAETRKVDNVIADEGRMPKKVATTSGAVMGMFVLSSVGASSAPSAGIDVGLAFRTGHFGLTGNGRLGGMGSGDSKISTVSIDVGTKLYLTDGEWAPFLGAGAGLSHFSRHGGDGSGGEAFATAGIELMRTAHVGFVVAARVDLPFYALEGAKGSTYAAPVSLGVALAFH